MTRIWWILTRALKVSKICTFIGSYCANYLKFGLKKYRGIIFHDNEEWSKIWRKTDLWFGKWTEEYGKFSPECLKVSKLGVWWAPLIQNRKIMSLKFTKESWQWRMIQNLERNRLVVSKLTWGIDEFWPEHLKVSNIFTSMCSIWAKYILLQLKKG